MKISRKSNNYKRIFSGIMAVLTFAATLPTAVLAEGEMSVSSVNFAKDDLLTNVSNAKSYTTADKNTYWDYSSSVYIDDYINIVFSEDVDKTTVNKDTIKITKQGSSSAIAYTPIVEGNKVKIDLSNLRSNFNYEINVTQDVTSKSGVAAEEYSTSFKAGLIAKAPHKGGKAIELVSIGKTATKTLTDGTEENVGRLVDGIMEGTAVTCAQWSGTNKEFFTIDLGESYDIAALGAFRNNTGATHHMFDTSLYVCDSKPTAEYIGGAARDVYLGPFGDNGVLSGNNNENAALSEVKNGRYVAVIKASDNSGGGAYLNEILVFAYVSDKVGEWNVNENGGKIEFSVPYTPAIKSTDYMMVMSTYDKDGNMIEIATSEENDGENYSGEINYAENAVSARAVIAEKGNMTAIKTKAGVYGEDFLSKDMGSCESFENALEYKTFDSKFTLTGKKVNDNELISLSVVKSDSETSEDVDFDNADYFATAGGEGKGYEFTLSMEEMGKYWIKVLYIDENRKMTEKYFTFTVIDPVKKEQVIKAFTETDGTDMSEIAEKWIDQEQLIGNLLDREEIEKDGFGKIFADIKDYCITEENPEINDIVVALDNAIIISKLNNGDSSLLSKLSDNEDLKNYISEVLEFSLDADVSCDYDESKTVTNIGNDGIIKILFTEPMKKETLNSTNIVIKKNGSVLEYEPFSVGDKEYVIDIASFASDYQNLLTNPEDNLSIEVSGCLTADGKKLVKSYSYDFTGGIIIKAPHKDGMIIKNVALNKPVKVSGNGAVPSTAQKLTDGKWSSAESDLAKCSNDTPTFIDLQSYYNVCGVHFVGWTRILDGEYKDGWYIVGVHVEGAAYEPAFDKENISIYKTNAKDGTIGKSHMHFAAGAETEGLVRYIRVDKDREFLNNTFWASELEVYAYVDEQIDAFSAPESINVGGANNVSVNIEESAGLTYGLLMSCYDKDGKVLKTKYAEKKAPSTIETGVNAPTGTVGMSVSLVSDLKTMNQSLDNLVIGEKIGVAPDEGEGIAFNVLTEGASLNIITDEKIKKTDRYSVTIITDDEKGKTSEEAFAEVNKNNIEDKLIYNAVGRVENGVKLTFDKFSEGMYYVRVSITDIGGNATNKYYKFRKVSESERLSHITEVMTGDETKALNGLKNIFEEKEILLKSELIVPTTEINADLCKYFLMVRDMNYTAEEAGKVTDIAVVEKLTNTTLLIKALTDGTATEELFEANKKSVAEISGEDVKFDKLNPIFGELKKNITDTESLKKVLTWSGLLAQIKSATNEKAATVIKNNSTVLGIDLTYASKRNVSVERACAFLDKENVVGYYEDGAFDTAFKTAVDKAYSGGNYTSSSAASSSGSPSKGTPGAANPQKPSVPVITPTEPVSKADPFGDIAGFGWAREAIVYLAEKNIVNGNEHNNFLPGDYITRAEFIKMLVMATKIEVKEDVEMHFMDISHSDWFYPYIEIAYSNALCSGIDEFHFNPRGNLTRQDMAVIINNCKQLGLKDKETEEAPFSDEQKIADYAKEAVANMKKYGVIKGFEDNSFRPTENLRRAEAAQIIYTLIKDNK